MEQIVAGVSRLPQMADNIVRMPVEGHPEKNKADLPMKHGVESQPVPYISAGAR